jgi:plastocyanin
MHAGGKAGLVALAALVAGSAGCRDDGDRARPVTGVVELGRVPAGSADGGRQAGHRGGGLEARTEGPTVAFHGRVRPRSARVVVRGARGAVTVDRRGAFLVGLRRLPPGVTRIVLEATTPGRRAWRERVDVLRGPTGVPPAREPQAAEPNRGSPGAADPSGGKIDVGVRDFAFFPRSVRVHLSQIVVWHNLDHVEHTIVAVDPRAPGPRARRLRFNDRYEFTAVRAGRVRYACTIHPWVRGELLVAPHTATR